MEPSPNSQILSKISKLQADKDFGWGNRTTENATKFVFYDVLADILSYRTEHPGLLSSTYFPGLLWYHLHSKGWYMVTMDDVHLWVRDHPFITQESQPPPPKVKLFSTVKASFEAAKKDPTYFIPPGMKVELKEETEVKENSEVKENAEVKENVEAKENAPLPKTETETRVRRSDREKRQRVELNPEDIGGGPAKKRKKHGKGKKKNVKANATPRNPRNRRVKVGLDLVEESQPADADPVSPSSFVV